MSVQGTMAGRWGRRLAWTILILGTTGLVLLALLVTAARFALPLTETDNVWIADLLEARLGYEVRLGSAALGLSGLTLSGFTRSGPTLSGLRPRLTVRDVVLSDRQLDTTVLALDALTIEIDPIASLRTGMPQITGMTLVGSTVAVRIDREGRLQVDGLELLRGKDPKAMEFLLTQAQVELVIGEIQIRDERPATPWDGLRLTAMHLQLRNEGERHSLSAGAALHPLLPGVGPVQSHDWARGMAVPLMAPENRLRLIAELSGPVGEPLAWSGRLYAGLDAGDLDPLLQGNGLDAVSVHTGRSRIESWSRISAGHLEQALVRVDLDRLRLAPRASVDRGASAAQPLRLESLGALLRVRPREAGWQIQIGDVSGRLAGTEAVADDWTGRSPAWGASADAFGSQGSRVTRVAGADLPRLDLDLVLDADRQPERLRFQTEAFDLAAVASMARQLPWALPESVVRLLDARPRGQIDNLAAQVQWTHRDPPAWELAAQGANLGWDRAGAVPGVDGLAARLRLDSSGGEAQIDSSALALDLVPLFSAPLHLDRLSGWLDWQRQESGAARLSARHLTFENADLAGRVRLALDLAADGASPELDLRASFHDGEGARVRTYLPVGIMHPDLVRWLERAVVSGRVPQADLVFRGPLDRYPFREHEGRFELLLELEDAVLDYLDEWPEIREAAGRLSFLNQSLAIELDHGRILDSRLAQARGDIDELWGVQHMAIVGEVQGPFSDGLRALTETPLAKDLGHLGEAFDVTGESQLRLEIDLPFTSRRPLGILGRLSWPKPATLAVKGTPLLLSGLGGELTFTQNSLAANSIEAELWDQPLSLSIDSLNPGDPDASATAIKARSSTSVAELARQFPDPAWDIAQEVVAGALDWTLDVTIRNRDLKAAQLPIEYRLTSSLKGLSIDLPAPLGKTAAASRELDLAGDLVPNRSLRLAGRLGDLAGGLRVDSSAVPARALRAHLRFGGATPPSPEANGVFVDGRLEQIDLPAWRKRLDALYPGAAAGNASRIGDGADDAGAWFSGADLRIDRLMLGGPRLTDVALTLAPISEGVRRGGWAIDAQANELAGRLEIPAMAGEPIDLTLAHLDLAAFNGDAAGDRAEDQSSGRDVADPADMTDTGSLANLPAVDLSIARLSWGKTLLGTLELDLRPDELGFRVPDIRISGDGVMSAQGEAAWRRPTSRSLGRSDLSMQIASPDVGALLVAMDAQERIEGAPLQTRFTLDWPGGFDDFRLAGAQGVVDLQLGAGRLLEVEPGVGRLLGFLNLSALRRRLSMDFTDLYAQGFAFEEMGGQIRVAHGLATLEDFTIEGPASKVIVAGASDLVNQRFDQTLIVEPRLGTGVALASAVAGGPVVGAAVYLVDRLAGNAFDRLGRYRYRVTGAWSDPQVERVGWDPTMNAETLDAAADGSSPPKALNHFLE